MAGTRRPRRSNGPTVVLTQRDGRALAELSRWGAMAAELVAAWCGFGSAETCKRRLWLLTKAGYVLTEWPMGACGPAMYRVTQTGAERSYTGMTVVRRYLQTLPHRLAMPSLVLALLRAHPGATWTTERELRRDALDAGRDSEDGRIRRGAGHIPDGCLTSGDGTRVAVELELSGKSLPDYQRILRYYALPVAGGYRRCLWFSDRSGVLARLEQVVAARRLGDVVSVGPLPAGVTVRWWT